MSLVDSVISVFAVFFELQPLFKMSFCRHNWPCMSDISSVVFILSDSSSFAGHILVPSFV